MKAIPIEPKVNLEVELSDDVLTKIDELCKIHNLTPDELIEQSLNNVLAKRISVTELVEKMKGDDDSLFDFFGETWAVTDESEEPIAMIRPIRGETHGSKEAGCSQTQEEA